MLEPYVSVPTQIMAHLVSEEDFKDKMIQLPGVIPLPEEKVLAVADAHGNIHKVGLGKWIIKDLGAVGNFYYPCLSEVFAMKYRKA